MKRKLQSHPDLQEFNLLLESVRKLQFLARKHGIRDVFQDNGGKLLQVLLTLNLIVIPGRNGNDLKNEENEEFELKTVNSSLTQSFSTHHHMNKTIINKYRPIPWIFAVYDDIELKEIYRVHPLFMSSFYDKWEEQIEIKNKELNNPKIPLDFVKQNGNLLWKNEKPL